jgi:tetratricopeptide (TPR) repeat protein
MIPNKGLCCVAALLLAWVAADAAADRTEAQAAPEAAKDPAALRRDANALYDRGDRAGAIALWEQYLGSATDPGAWEVLYNIARAHDELLDVTAALEGYDRFARAGREREADLGEPQRAALADAESRVQQLKSSHGAVRISAADGRPVSWRIGGGVERKGGETVWIKPGKVEVWIRTGTREPRAISVEVERGVVTEIRADARADVPDGPAKRQVGVPRPDVPEPRGPEPAFPVGWVAAGFVATGVTASVVGGVLLWVELDKGRAASEAASDGPRSPAYASAYDDYTRARDTTLPFFVVPGALLTATLIGIGVHEATATGGTAKVALRAAGTGVRLEVGF